jgi:hypothetical protein
VAICTQIAPGAAAANPPGPFRACSVAGPSASMVMTIPAPAAASAGLAATAAPSAVSAAAWLAVRSHARTVRPLWARFAAIGAPMRPVPRNAIAGVAVPLPWPGRAGVIWRAVGWVMVMTFLPGRGRRPVPRRP